MSADSERSSDNKPDGHDFHSPIISVADLPDHCFPTFSITEEERHAIELQAVERARNTPGYPNVNREARGLGGELVVSRIFDRQVDTETYEGGDGGFDFKIGAKRIDVKTRGRRSNNPDLLVSANKPVRADYYILVQELSRYDYRVLGYAPAEAVEKARTMIIKSNSPARELVPSSEVRVVEQDRITPLTQSALLHRRGHRF